MNNQYIKICSDLEALGLHYGDSVLVHSSYKALGYEGSDGIKTFIDALRDVLGKDGTLLLPSLSYSTVNRARPFFDIRSTPCCVGAIPEFFRQLPGVKRSLSPTHSVCGIGRLTFEMLSEHQLDDTPCGSHSPFKKLMETEGKILLCGCGTKPNTSMHAVEETVMPYYLFGPRITYHCTDENGKQIDITNLRHNFSGHSLLQRYDRLIDVLSNDDYSSGKILNADSWLIQTVPMWKKAADKMRIEEEFFVQKESEK